DYYCSSYASSSSWKF
nr:immunoglobulin light chain junction region [Macaca mulatta]